MAAVFICADSPFVAESCRSGDLTGFHSLGVSCRPIIAAGEIPMKGCLHVIRPSSKK